MVGFGQLAETFGQQQNGQDVKKGKYGKRSKERKEGQWPQYVPSSFLLLVVRPGAPSGVLAPSSDARSP